MSNHYSFASLLSRLQAELNRLFEEFEELAQESHLEREWQPGVDVFETKQAVVIVLGLPGVQAEEVELQVIGQDLTVSGSKRTNRSKEKDERFLRVERHQGDFRRSLRLPRPVNGAQATASLQNGELEVIFPKIREQRQRRHRIVVQEARHEPDGEIGDRPGAAPDRSG